MIRRTPVEERLEVALEKGICYSYVSTDNIGGKIKIKHFF